MPPRVLQVALFLTLLLPAVRANADGGKPHFVRKVTVGDGLHLWYEIKADPEDSARLIICGTKWDALANTPFGFVYFSGDTGLTWRNVLEDRSSIWVTEHSCAFGPQHRAYFVSDAANETDIGPDPKRGTTRLFLSSDGGEHWAESARTGWTDYSTSAVSKASGNLYTFFQASWMARDSSRQKGNDLGVVVFSSDARTVTGPYFSSGTSERGYDGIYPSNATSLDSGAVVALFYAKRQTPRGTEADLGVLRADQSPDPVLTRTVIAHPHIDSADACLNFDSGSMAYDQRHNKIFVIYSDGCGADDRTMLTSSEDEGRTWSASIAISRPKSSGGKVYSPSLVVVSDRILGLLWEDKPFSPTWLFSYIEDGVLVEPPLTLSEGSDEPKISNDSLWTQISEPGAIQTDSANTSTTSGIGVNVYSMLNSLWRTDGVLLSNGKVLCVWSSGTDEGMRLYSGLIETADSHASADAVHDSELNDVTRDTLLLYAGDRNDAGQQYDEETGTLSICASLRNRGHHTIKSPIEIRLESLRSQWGPVSALNGTNTLIGSAAVWKLGGSLTGDRILPGTTSNPFCMLFQFGITPKNLPPIHVDLLSFTLRVFAREGVNRDISAEPARLPK